MKNKIYIIELIIVILLCIAIMTFVLFLYIKYGDKTIEETPNWVLWFMWR